MHSWHFSGGPVAKTPHYQCKGPRFEPLSGNSIPHAATKTWHSQINKCFKCISKEPSAGRSWWHHKIITDWGRTQIFPLNIQGPMCSRVLVHSSYEQSFFCPSSPNFSKKIGIPLRHGTSVRIVPGGFCSMSCQLVAQGSDSFLS